MVPPNRLLRGGEKNTSSPKKNEILIQTQHLFASVMSDLTISVKCWVFFLLVCFNPHFLKRFSCCPIIFTFFFISARLTKAEFKFWCQLYTNKVHSEKHLFYRKRLSCFKMILSHFFFVNCYRKCWLVLWFAAHCSQWGDIGSIPLVCLSKKELLDLSSFPCKHTTCYLKTVNKSLRLHDL